MKILRVILLGCWFMAQIFPAAAETFADVPENPKQALIIIHGYGQDGKRMQWMTDRLKDVLPDTAFYYPTAPDRAPHHGYQWFPIPILGAQMSEMSLYKKMLAGAVDNVAELHDLADEIHQDLNIPYENINVAGFSQGGLMAVLTVLTNPNRLGRAVSFSGVPLVLTDRFDEEMIVQKPEILLIQGTGDAVIPAESMSLTQKALEAADIIPQIKEIRGMGHEINPRALQYAVDFLK